MNTLQQSAFKPSQSFQNKVAMLAQQAQMSLYRIGGPDFSHFVQESFESTKASSQKVIRPIWEKYVPMKVGPDQEYVLVKRPTWVFSPSSIVPQEKAKTDENSPVNVNLSSTQSANQSEASEKEIEVDDHWQTRPDVVGKGMLRTGFRQVIAFCKEKTKGRKDSKRFFTTLNSLFTEMIAQFATYSNKQKAELFGIVSLKILKKSEFESKVRAWETFDDELKQMIIDEGNGFHRRFKNFSTVPQRENALKHHVFKFFKHLISHNEYYEKQFWKRFEGKRSEIISEKSMKMQVKEELSKIGPL